ncbi:MAG: HupE/UreJ family protein [Photobacterium frigidiphilum]|uniref:HupE/UreJ family protein n=1 Tax=Photobacterium frigidiphilum TaxID=264736 RepID=UPI0030015A01
MRKLLPMMGLLLASPSTFAHVVGAQANMVSGLIHPLTGWDHALVMIGLGIATAIGSKNNAKARTNMAMILAVYLLAGALIASAGWVIESFEALTTLSIFMTGIILISGMFMKQRGKAVYVCAAAMAVVHGYTHLVEAHHSAGSLSFMVGMCISSLAMYYFGAVNSKFATNHFNIKQISAVTGSVYLLLGALIAI